MLKFNLKFLSLIFIFINLLIINTSILANTPTPINDKQKLAQMIYNSKCPDAIKRVYLKVGDNNQLLPELKPGIQINNANGTIVQGYKLDNNGNRKEMIPLNCMHALDLEKILVRIFLGITGLIGVVFALAMIKGIFELMTAPLNPENKANAYKGVYMPVVYLILLIFSYFLLVNFMVDFLGIGKNPDKKEYSLFCKNQIIISIAFDQIPDCTKREFDTE